MYDEILFPTDGSDAAESALAHAIGMADAYDARIHVLYVVDTTYAGVGAAGNTSINSLREEATSVVESTASRIEDAGRPVETAIREGHPYDEILAYSEDGIDVIVMGTRGRSGVDRYLLGSVTEKIVRTAEPPVFTVRPDEAST